LDVAATKVQERLSFVDRGGFDRADYDRVVAAGQKFRNATFHRGNGSCDERRAGRAIAISDLAKLVGLAGGEAARDEFLILGQHVHREGAADLQAIVNSSALVDANQRQRRFERQRTESGHRDSHRLSIGELYRDDRHAGGKVSQGSAKLSFFDSHDAFSLPSVKLFCNDQATKSLAALP